MPITKLQAAQQQLDCSIRLLLNEDDMSSVITLSRAAFRILSDIYPILKPGDRFSGFIDTLITSVGRKQFNEIANQLKHADNDPDAVMEPHPIPAMVGIGLAVTLYHQITGERTPEMQAFETVMSMIDHEVFAGPHDPEHENYAEFMRAFEHMQDATHEQLMEVGRGALHFLKTRKVEDKDPNPPRKD